MGRGRKICKACNKPCGPRSHNCPHCGEAFSFKTGATAPEKKEELANTSLENLKNLFPGYAGGNIIYTPGTGYPRKGPICPVEPPKRVTDKEIVNWVEELLAYANEHRFYYTTDAVKYMARAYWPEDCVRINKIIDGIYDTLKV